MSECCSTPCTTKGPARKHRCPVNGREYSAVSEKTILHHIRAPWSWTGRNQSYYFCDDPDCEVVYFGQDESIIEKSDLRTTVGVKEASDDALVCYCFGVTVADLASPETRAFVAEKAKGHVCECEARNPSGKCCLKDFPSHEIC